MVTKQDGELKLVTFLRINPRTRIALVIVVLIWMLLLRDGIKKKLDLSVFDNSYTKHYPNDNHTL